MYIRTEKNGVTWEYKDSDMKEICKEHGWRLADIKKCCNGERKTYYQCTWKYRENPKFCIPRYDHDDKYVKDYYIIEKWELQPHLHDYDSNFINDYLWYFRTLGGYVKSGEYNMLEMSSTVASDLHLPITMAHELLATYLTYTDFSGYPKVFYDTSLIK